MMSIIQKIDIRSIIQKIDSDKARIGLIISFCMVLVGAILIFYHNLFGAHERPNVFLKCSHSECDYSDMMTYKSFNRLAEKQVQQFKSEHPDAVEKLIGEAINGRLGQALPLSNNPDFSEQEKKDDQRARAEDSIVNGWGGQFYDLPARCRECDRYTVFQAQNCANPDCGVTFLMFDNQSKLQITCPACGKSLADRGEEN